MSQPWSKSNLDHQVDATIELHDIADNLATVYNVIKDACDELSKKNNQYPSNRAPKRAHDGAIKKLQSSMEAAANIKLLVNSSAKQLAPISGFHYASHCLRVVYKTINSRTPFGKITNQAKNITKVLPVKKQSTKKLRQASMPQSSSTHIPTLCAPVNDNEYSPIEIYKILNAEGMKGKKRSQTIQYLIKNKLVPVSKQVLYPPLKHPKSKIPSAGEARAVGHGLLMMRVYKIMSPS